MCKPQHIAIRSLYETFQWRLCPKIIFQSLCSSSVLYFYAVFFVSLSVFGWINVLINLGGPMPSGIAEPVRSANGATATGHRWSSFYDVDRSRRRTQATSVKRDPTSTPHHASLPSCNDHPRRDVARRRPAGQRDIYIPHESRSRWNRTAPHNSHANGSSV